MKFLSFKSARPIAALLMLLFGAAVFVALCGGGARSQIPRIIKLVVPVPPGGPQDTVARLLADEIARLQGPTIVVEDRPGAANVVATEAVARAKPDGATLLIHAATLLIGPPTAQARL